MKSGFNVYFPVILIGLIFAGITRVLAQDQHRKGPEQADSLLHEKKSRSAVERKISSQLLQAIKEYSGKKLAEGTQLEPADVHADRKGNLMVDISATVTDELLANIKMLGGQIIFPSKQYNTIRAQVPISSIEKIAAYEVVKFIKAAVLPQLNTRPILPKAGIQ